PTPATESPSPTPAPEADSPAAPPEPRTAERAPSTGSGHDQPAGTGSHAPGALDTAALRRQWPDVLERVRLISRRTWSGLQMAVLLDFDGRRVLLGMPDENWIRHFIGTP